MAVPQMGALDPEAVWLPGHKNTGVVCRPDFVPILLMAGAAAGLAYPSQSDIKWMEAIYGAAVPYNDSPLYWCPYVIAPSGVCVKPWYSAAYRYVTRQLPTCPQITQLDPADWRQNVANLISDFGQGRTRTAAAMSLALDQWVEPTDVGWLAKREAIDIQVRSRQQAGSLVVDTKLAKTMIAGYREAWGETL